jgi:hypothetical protein
MLCENHNIKYYYIIYMGEIFVADKPLYEVSNKDVEIGATVEIIDIKGINHNNLKYTGNNKYKIINNSTIEFIKGKYYNKTITDGVTTYLVITDDGNRYEIHSNKNEYYFKLQPVKTHGGKRKMRNRKTSKKSKIKTKTLRKRV